MTRKWRMLMRFTALAAVLVLGLNLQPVQAARGGGGKIAVTAADPAQADQGQELDVYISGDGFDDGSTATFYVTGTSDDTQIFVESTTYEPATGRLKSHIKVNGAALVTDYDIEVRTAGGRRGKGTTLFKVQQTQADTCTGFEDKTPKIAYLTEPTEADNIRSWDLHVSSISGCTQTLLLEGAQLIAFSDPNDNTPSSWIKRVSSLQISTGNNRGIVAWVDDAVETSITPSNVIGWVFTYDVSGNITPLTPTPVTLFESPEGNSAFQLDLAFNPAGEFELLIHQFNADTGARLLSTLNLDTGENQIVIDTGRCQITNADGVCFLRPYFGQYVFWGRTTDEVFARVLNEDSTMEAIARVSRVEGSWSKPEAFMFNGPGVSRFLLGSVSESGLVNYEFSQEIINKRGKSVGHERQYRVVDEAACSSTSPCTTGTGLQLDGVTPHPDSARWTNDDHIITAVERSRNSYDLYEYDILTGSLRSLNITGVDLFPFPGIDVSR